jgi:hypothetical protein
MGEILWMKFVDECVENMQEVLMTVGVNGLLAEYDRWMEAELYIKCEHGAYCRHTPNSAMDRNDLHNAKHDISAERR